jgi:predicted permease
MAIRLAIGASRAQLVRQLITESLLLAWSGAAAGLALATWATRALSAVQPPIEVRVAFDVSPDARVLGFTIGLATLTGLVFGLVPALHASRPDLVPSLKGEAGAGRARRVDLRRWLVAGEIALSTVLLVVGGLLLRSTVAAMHANTGVNASHVVYASVNGNKMYPDRARALQFYEEAARRLESIPGVVAVARASWMPLSLNHNTTVIDVEGVHGPAPDGGINVDTTDVGIEYFHVIGVPIVTGRAFDDRDTATGDRVAIVSAAAARAYWPGQSALGRQFRERNGRAYTVVGVSADYAVRAIGETPRPLVHFNIDQRLPVYQTFAVATDRPASDLIAPVRQTIVTLEPRAAFVELQPLSGLVDGVLFPVRAGAALLAGLSGLALVLATIGLYGVIAFNVSRRTREIGIRMALGASQGRVVRQVVVDGLVLVATGGLVGAAGAALAGRLVASALYGTTAFDPLAWMAALTALGLAAAAAAFVPARRAAAIDPMRALRQL